MADNNVSIFNQIENMEDSQLLHVFDNSTADVTKFMDKILQLSIDEGESFNCLYSSLLRTESFIVSMYRSYLIYCKQKSKTPVLSVTLKDVKVSRFPEDVFDAAKYFAAMKSMEKDFRNSYILSSKNISLYHLKIARKMHFETLGKTEGLVQELENVLKLVANPQGENLFSIFMELLKETANQPKDMNLIMEQIKRILEFANSVAADVKEAGIDIKCEVEACNSVYESFASFFLGSKSMDEQVKDSMSTSVQYGFTEPVDMLSKLLDFGEMEDEFKESFTKNVETFKNMSDKKSADDEARKLRKAISTQFYELYEKVFIRSEKENVEGVLLDLFLNYGVVDETYFKKETLDEMKQLSHTKEVKNVNVYTVKEWLHAIYEGKKQPSRNDLDMDYNEYIVNMEKRGEISAEQKQEYLNNSELKVNYEIENFVRMNSRLTNGELSVFCPILTEESFISTPTQMFVKDADITATVDWLLEVDYSVFHREQLYDSRENGITNMMISKQVFPDVIIMPVSGVNSRLWQEIDGKKRDTPGRFTFPAFTKADLKDMLAQSAGAFRWQLCKKIQGNYWNIVSEKSLTSEYYDYIQFYKKNRELSDQAKEKIGSQLQRARNNFAECFTMDYVIWVKNEVLGSVRLNKIVREIMAEYCPPSKPYRENLKNQPLFVEAFSRYERERVKKIKEINNRRAAIRNANGVETPEFIEEARFREEM